MNEKKKSFYNEKKTKNFMLQNLRATAHLSRQLGRWGAWALGRWGAGALVRWGAGAWALGERVCGRRWACVGARAGAAGARAQRQAELAAGWASGNSAQGARGAQATGGRRAGRHGLGAQGRAAGRTVRAGHGRPGRGLGAGWVADWASWASFGALCTWLSSGSVFGPGSTRYFPESPNEHCSL